MEKVTVYLAGKMTGLPISVMTAWRDKARESLEAAGFKVYDPVTAYFEANWEIREITASNKFMLARSDLILAEFDHEEASLGTISEIVWNDSKKPVVAWGRNRKIVNYPWVRDGVTKALETLDEALAYILRNYKAA